MTDAITLKEIIEIYQEQYSQTNDIWNYFSTVTLAVLGFTIGSDKIVKSLKDSITTYWFCKSCKKNQSQELSFLNPMSDSDISIFYWLVVISVIGGVIFITKNRNHNSADTNQ